MKYFGVSLFVLLLSSLLFSQERMILRANGEQIKLNHQKDLREAITESKIRTNNGSIAKNLFVNNNYKLTGMVDTLSYRKVGGTWNTNFGFFGQDVMMQFFEAQADMDIKGIGFTCSDDAGAANATVSFRLIKLNWSAEKMKSFDVANRLGYYPADADGMNNIDPFGEAATGNWVSVDTDNPLPPWTNHENPDSNTFNYDLWSDAGLGFPVTPIASPSNAPVYNWIDLSTTGLGDVEVQNREVFAVVATHDGINLDTNRIGFWSDGTLGIPGWKYYENGRSIVGGTDDSGWWIRAAYTWDFAVAVEVHTGPPPPSISNLTRLLTTLSREARTVEVTVEGGGGESGIAEVNLIYTINGGEEISVPMIADGDVYSAQIPGQIPGTEVTYWVMAVAVNGDVGMSAQAYTYKIFLVEDNNNLVVFNGFTSTTGYPQLYYFGTDTSYVIDWTYDSWAYGPLTKELVDNYTNIFEICTNGPNDYNREVIAEWLASNGSRNYLLSGEEWLGADKGYTDQDFSTGSFEYDILGITHSYNDISYDGTSGQELPSRLFPQEGTQLGGEMFNKVMELNAVDTITIDSVKYDPMYEIGQSSNWMDGFEVRDDAEVFMKAETRGIATVPSVQEVNAGISRVLPDGNKIAFMTYDPISIDSSPSYFWLGQGDASQTTQALFWFYDIVDVDENKTLPKAFTLSQNYPNPFNPSTTIKYSIPNSAVIANGVKQSNEIATSSNGTWTPRNDNFHITLKVYDILGREVATLINKEQKAGNYEVNFDGNGLTSGIYFYKLTSGTFSESKKMILLK